MTNHKIQVPRTVTTESITADSVAIALDAAVNKAKELGILINVALVDQAGLLMGFLRMHGAFIHSIEIAIDKAYTAASFGFPTSDWMRILAHDEALKIGLSGRPRLVIFGGGLPILVNGMKIGGIGVSGGSAEQDEICAKAGLAAINV